jgi:DNA-binding transcriptional ArsR family regulator
MKTILWWLIAGSKGGINRAKIIKELHDRPYNANQITERLGLDYKTVRHHLKVLSENGIIESNSGEKYGTMYFLSKNMEEDYALFLDIWNRIGLDKGRTEA